MKLNNNPLRRRRDLIGQMPVVFFSPEDLQLVKGDPGSRRRFPEHFTLSDFEEVCCSSSEVSANSFGRKQCSPPGEGGQSQEIGFISLG
ncbi:MAG: hypothetical protein ACE5IT_01885 [bacterium]